MTDTPWANDKLNRQADGEHLIRVMMERYEARKASGNGSYILNIDAAWGTGKTFFLENLAASLRADHVVGMVNAWQDDHSNDPLITVMAAIEGALKPFLDEEPKAKAAFRKGKQALGTVAAETGKQMAFHALKTVAGISVDKIADRVREATSTPAPSKTDPKDNEKDKDESFDKSFEKVWDASLKTLVSERVAQHQKATDAIRIFKEQTALAIEYAVGKGMRAPMFVFIDELDRCRPTYAIKFLEDVKHLFSIEGIVFVVATDSEQLAHSVKAIYGAEFEARKYLRRFFDRVFVFPEAKRHAFVAHLLEQAGIDASKVFFPLAGNEPWSLITEWADQTRLSNRDLVQCFEIISTFVTSWEHELAVEPLYLLALVYAFYTDEIITFKILENGGQIKSNSMAEWHITYQVQDINTGGMRATSAKVTDWLQSSAGRMIEPKTSITVGPVPYEIYIDHERQNRFPNGMFVGSREKSLLGEYPSRVRNAGRVIDR
ncbi:KAP family P-loop NTPase fold protein [Sphingomonas sp. Leaf257]|jgi:hypothetical protein|uniref:KAP family P-loop NTPase fold protein n=1 Tax=Sphingomonas sp. Leaf257 TaxID=1736309 RepID=UPI0009E915E3|nr:P-loop NTPase fold protein [Sphingomonas sp. Leaf257]